MIGTNDIDQVQRWLRKFLLPSVSARTCLSLALLTTALWMLLSAGMIASDTVPAGIVQPSLASLGDVAVGACCYYSLDLWKGARASMDSRIPDHRLLTNFRTALLSLLRCSQTFPDKSEM